jgi:hypothetical protein
LAAAPSVTAVDQYLADPSTRDRFGLHLRPSPTDEADHAKIEEFLYTHPDIKDAQVIGVPDPKYGDELCAWIQMRDGATPLTVAAVREFADGSWRLTRSRSTCRSFRSSR